MPSGREGALREARQQNQKNPERHRPKGKGTISSPKTADEQEDQIEAQPVGK